MRLKKGTVTTIQVIIVLVAPAVIAYLLPEEVLIPVAWTGFLGGIAAVLAMKAWQAHLVKIGEIDQGGQRQFLFEIGMTFALVALVSFFMLVIVYD
jgi:hypothetical protein